MAKDTSGSINTTDDVIISKDGYLGIGTVTPKSRLDLQGGQLRIVDGTQADQYVLTATDNNGKAQWLKPDVAVKIGEWKIVYGKFPGYQSYNEIRVTDGHPTLATLVDNSQIPLVGTNKDVTLPAGKYLIFVNQDLAGSEYGTFRLKNAADNSIVYQQPYAEWLAGGVAFVNFPVATTLYVTWQAKDMYSASGGYFHNIGDECGLNFCDVVFMALD